MFPGAVPELTQQEASWSGCRQDWLSHLSFPVLLKPSFATQQSDMSLDGLVISAVLFSWRSEESVTYEGIFLVIGAKIKQEEALTEGDKEV